MLQQNALFYGLLISRTHQLVRRLIHKLDEKRHSLAKPVCGDVFELVPCVCLVEKEVDRKMEEEMVGVDWRASTTIASYGIYT